jgi:hypothetical protein
LKEAEELVELQADQTTVKLGYNVIKGAYK